MTILRSLLEAPTWVGGLLLILGFAAAYVAWKGLRGPW